MTDLIRKLSDLKKPTKAEEKLLAEYWTGEIVEIGEEVPDERDGAEVEIRAGLIRYLLLGGCDDLPHPVHEKGVQVLGARITGALDLQGVQVDRALYLVKCHFGQDLTLFDARLDGLNLNRSVLDAALYGDRLETRGGVFLRWAMAAGVVRLPGARVGGNLDCDGAHLNGAENALHCDGLTTGGDVFLRGATAAGAVSLLGARVGGDLGCVGAHLNGAEDALSCDRLTTGGDVFLRGATVAGAVRLHGARVGGNLDCDGAHLNGAENALHCDGLTTGGDVFLREATAAGEVRLLGARVGGDLACDGATFRGNMHCDGARIDGALFWRNETTLDGVLGLSAARIGSLADDPACWPKPGKLFLNRCEYGAFVGEGISAEERIRWLELQDPAQVGQDFWPQPWEHCAKVLREMGHEDDARKVLIRKEQLQRADRRKRFPRLARPMIWLGDRVLGTIVGYGHRPLRALFFLGALWALGAMIFGAAERVSAIKPNSVFVLRSPEWVLCAHPAGVPVDLPSLEGDAVGLAAPGQSQLDCFRATAEAEDYPQFNGWVYALDTLFPVFDVEMQENWLPDAGADRDRPTAPLAVVLPQAVDWLPDAAGAYLPGWQAVLPEPVLAHPVPMGLVARVYLKWHIALGWALSLLAIAGFSGIVRIGGGND